MGAKIRVLEVHRTDDARHERELKTRLAEAEPFVALRPKRQAKPTTQPHTTSSPTQLAELAENRVLDAQGQLEMAALDETIVRGLRGINRPRMPRKYNAGGGVGWCVDIGERGRRRGCSQGPGTTEQGT